MKIKNICIITNQYPSNKRMAYTFLEQLVNKFSDNNINCYVISPQSLTRNIINKYPLNSKKYIRTTTKRNVVHVYAPYYFTFSSKLIKLNLHSFYNIVENTFSKLNKEIKFDVIYAHFIFPSAITANMIGKKYNLPVFFAYGENTNYSIDYLGKEKTKKLLEGINGVISVSGENKRRLIENEIVPKDIIEVLPNGIDNTIFYKKNKELIRKKLGYNENDFIIIFVGRFITLKGIDRLCKALDLINNSSIKAIFIGTGDIKPKYNYTLYEGELDQCKIVDYLSASDVFVLPTIAEGCCNAIIEAMACGLPVVSSNQSFNDEILDDSCSIRIDSMNIYEIKNAIEKLYKSEELRTKLSIGALKKAQKLNIEERAKKIIAFIEKRIDF